MTRVIAGVAGGRRLAVPSGRSTRPTSDRAREALFSTLEALRGPLAGASFLDLYAGSGAVGLEAASRGATHVVLVESAPRAARVVAENVRVVGVEGVCVARVPVERFAAGPPPPDERPYDVVFCDPPYETPAETVRGVLGDLAAAGRLAAAAVVVVERATRDGGFRWPEGFAGDRSRRYGEGTLWYGRAA